jgi:CBS domain containing-hemolysin-like protein
MDGGAVAQLVVVIGCVILSAFASAAETGLTGVRRSRILQLAEEQANKRARLVAGLLGAPQRFLTTILVLNSVAVIVASSLATELSLRYMPANPPWLRDVAAAVVISSVVLICSEITPKLLAIQNTERAALLLGPIVNVFSTLLTPLIAVLTWITGGLARLFGGQTTRLDHQYTEEELRMLVEVGEQQGVLEEEETAMIHGVFEFGDTLVREVMRPRIDVSAVAVDAPIQEVVDVAMNAGHSRIPMFENSIDNVIGVLYVKDLLRFLLPDQQPINLRDLARPPFFVPESQKVTQVFHDMRATKVHMAIVVDEYGGTAGVVTIEDLLEEIVGDIQDEYDTEAPTIEAEEEGVYLVDGSVSMSTIDELMEMHLESDAYDTIGGLVYSQLGAEPSEGEKAVVGPLQATVVEMDGRRVRRVRVQRRSETPETDGSGGAK